MAASVLCTGCASPPMITPADVVSPVDVIAELKKSAAGYNAGDLEAFIAIYAENATFAHGESFLRGKAAIRALYAPAFVPGVERDSLALDRVEVDRISTEAVLVRALYHNARQGVAIQRGTMSLWMRLINGQWRVMHDHSS